MNLGLCKKNCIFVLGCLQLSQNHCVAFIKSYSVSKGKEIFTSFHTEHLEIKRNVELRKAVFDNNLILQILLENYLLICPKNYETSNHF